MGKSGVLCYAFMEYAKKHKPNNRKSVWQNVARAGSVNNAMKLR